MSDQDKPSQASNTLETLQLPLPPIEPPVSPTPPVSMPPMPMPPMPMTPKPPVPDMSSFEMAEFLSATRPRELEFRRGEARRSAIPHVDTRTPEELIAEARGHYEGLLKGGMVADIFAADIPKELAKAGVGFEALDPTGKRSASEMETAFNTAYRSNGLRQAREDLSDLGSSAGVSLVERSMERHGFTAAELLNHDGVNLSPEAAKAALDGKFRDVHLKEVREYASELPSINTERLVKLLMEKHGFTAVDVLNKDGVNLTPEAAQATLDGKFREANLRETREYASNLNSGNTVSLVKLLMEQGGFTAADVLNHDGVNLSPEAAQATLDGKFRDAHLKEARGYAEDMKTARRSNAQQLYADLAGQALDKAGIDADTNDDGKFSKREIKDAIKGLPKFEVKDEGPLFKSAPNTHEAIDPKTIASNNRDGGRA